MKTYIYNTFALLILSGFNFAMAQYDGCPHGNAASGSEVGHLAWRIKDPATGAIVYSAPAPNTVYQLEIYETPFDGTPPNYIHYVNIGIQGTADGFKLYSSVSSAINNPNDYFDDQTISSGVGPDVGLSGVAVFGIKTLPASDPNWSGQLTAFKAYGICYPSQSGYPNKFYKKTLVILP